MLHILVIDDNVFFTATFASLLERTGYRVSVAGSPEESRLLQQRDPADLVLMGIYLGKRGVGAYLRDMRGIFADTPVIALCSDRDHNHSQYPLLLRELGQRRIHHKPFRTEDLLAAIHAEAATAGRRRAC